jgi:hypothetical protein
MCRDLGQRHAPARVARVVGCVDAVDEQPGGIGQTLLGGAAVERVRGRRGGRGGRLHGHLVAPRPLGLGTGPVPGGAAEGIAPLTWIDLEVGERAGWPRQRVVGVEGEVARLGIATADLELGGRREHRDPVGRRLVGEGDVQQRGVALDRPGAEPGDARLRRRWRYRTTEPENSETSPESGEPATRLARRGSGRLLLAFEANGPFAFAEGGAGPSQRESPFRRGIPST